MSDEQGRFTVGIIGAGMGAKPHALALQSFSDTIAVHGVYRRDRAELERFCASYGFPVAESYEAMLADPAIDAILVLTTPNVHEVHVMAAAQAGKHILLEKPIERSLAAAERIVAGCEAAGVQLGVVFQHRFRPGARLLAEIAAENRYGRLEAVHLVVPWWRPQNGYYDQPGRGTLEQDGGGVLLTQAIHALDLMLSLCGPVAAVTALATTTRLHQMETEDFVSAGLEFDNGAVGAMMATTANFPGAPESLTLNFAQASVVFTDGTVTIQTRSGDTIIESEPSVTGGGSGADPMSFPYAWHAEQISEFVASVRSGRPPASSGQTALEVHRLIDALMRSAKQERRVTVQRA